MKEAIQRGLKYYPYIYELQKIKNSFSCHVQKEYDLAKGANFFIILVLYDTFKRFSKIIDSRKIPSKIDELDADSPLPEIVNKIGRTYCPNVKLINIKPILTIEDTLNYKNNQLTNYGFVFTAQIRNKTLDDLKIQFNVKEDIDFLSKCILNHVRNSISNEEFAEACLKEANTNEKYRGRYWFHNNFVKKFILTNHLKKKKEFLNILRERIRDAKTILDVSCGDSSLLVNLVNPSIKWAVGNDISWSQVSLIKRTLKNILYTNHDATNLPFKNKAFDISICSNTLHHMPSKYFLKKLFLNLERVSKRILIVEIEDPLQIGGIPLFLNKYWYQKFLGDVGENYYSEEKFQKTLSNYFSEKYHINFFSFKNIQGKYLIAELIEK